MEDFLRHEAYEWLRSVRTGGEYDVSEKGKTLFRGWTLSVGVRGSVVGR